MPTATIVCYHYVRELRGSHFPGIKGLEAAAFREQVAYFRRFYNFVDAAQVAAALDGRDELPPRALLMTFDDGYADHYTWVFPVLNDLGISGCFYPPVHAVRDGQLLDVNKIHFALAAAGGEALYAEVCAALEEIRKTQPLPSLQELQSKYAVASRHDPAEIVFVKRLLQRGLPAGVRGALATRLFRKYVTNDEEAFARELYLSENQIRTMLQHGMHFGSHGATHRWLDSLSEAEQAQEIDRSLEWLGTLGATRDLWTMCYPYGSRNDTTTAILGRRDCAFALTIDPGVAELTPENRFTLRRLDTNEFPVASTAEPNRWTQVVM